LLALIIIIRDLSCLPRIFHSRVEPPLCQFRSGVAVAIVAVVTRDFRSEISYFGGLYKFRVRVAC